MFCRNIHELDLIFYLANKAIPNKNGVLDILSHMVRPRNTHGVEAGNRHVTIFMKLTASFNMLKRGWGGDQGGFDYIITSKMLYLNI